MTLKLFWNSICVAASNLTEAVRGATYIQECTPENLELKGKIFEELESALKAAGNTSVFLGSSTSTIMPSKFVAKLEIRERMLVAHPVSSPVFLLKNNGITRIIFDNHL